MNPAEQERFTEAMRQFSTRMQWLFPRPDGALDLEKIKLVIAEWEGIWRWRGKVTSVEVARQMDELQAMIKFTKARMRLVFLRDIGRLLKIHRDWKVKETLLKVPKLFQDTLNIASPEDREKMLADVREMNKREFDVEREFREAMEEADQWQKHWESSLASFKRFWPEECKPQMERRLARLNGADAKKWGQENLEEMIRIRARHPDIPESG